MEHPDFGVYGMAPSKRASAVHYYRADVPLRTFHKLDLCHIYIPTGDDSEMDNNALTGASVVTAWQLTGERGNRFAHLITEELPEVVDNPEGLPEYRPILIMDSDDALDLVDPFNPAYAVYGIRDFTGEFLSPGQTVSWTDADGNTTPMWEDLKMYGQGGHQFDIARNLKNMALYYETARMCAGVTVTNEILAKIYRDEGVKNVHVFPNSVIPEDYPTVALQPHDGIRLLWEGGSSHMESWMTIREPLREVLRDNPHVKLVVFGGPPLAFQDEIPEAQLEIHDWVDYAAYRYKRVMLGADINLCPLQGTPFNECKSAIRWYEGCMSPTPEPALAVNFGPYKEITDGETSLLFNTKQEFREKLQTLIDNADLRQRLGEAGRKWVLDNRHAEKTVPDLFRFYHELKERQIKDISSRALSAGA